MSAQDICAAGAIMGHSEATIRVALTRLLQQGKIVKLERGSYAFDTQRHGLHLDVESWRERIGWIVPWSGDWVVVADGAVRPADRTTSRRRQRALLLRGFQKWKPNLHVRPNNLAGGLTVLREQLPLLGMARGAELFLASGFDPKQSAALLSLWNIPAMRLGHEKLLARVETSQRRIARLGVRAAARESLLVGRDLIGQILRDPLLPPEIVSGVGVRKLAQEVASYQTESRKIWKKAIEEARGD